MHASAEVVFRFIQDNCTADLRVHATATYFFWSPKILRLVISAQMIWLSLGSQIGVHWWTSKKLHRISLGAIVLLTATSWSRILIVEVSQLHRWHLFSHVYRHSCHKPAALSLCSSPKGIGTDQIRLYYEPSRLLPLKPEYITLLYSSCTSISQYVSSETKQERLWPIENTAGRLCLKVVRKSSRGQLATSSTPAELFKEQAQFGTVLPERGLQSLPQKSSIYCRPRVSIEIVCSSLSLTAGAALLSSRLLRHFSNLDLQYRNLKTSHTIPYVHGICRICRHISWGRTSLSWAILLMVIRPGNELSSDQVKIHR